MKTKSSQTQKLAILAGTGLLTAALSLPVLAMSHPSAHGTAVSNGQADREITLVDGAKYLNVHRNETVRINVGGESFTWRFDTLGLQAFALADIVPAGVAANGVTVYVAEDPAYLN